MTILNSTPILNKLHQIYSPLMPKILLHPSNEYLFILNSRLEIFRIISKEHRGYI